MTRGAELAIPNDIHEGDCIELLKTLPDRCAQLIIADPPYNLGPRFGVAKEWLRDPSWLNWCAEWLRECPVDALRVDRGDLRALALVAVLVPDEDPDLFGHRVTFSTAPSNSATSTLRRSVAERTAA